MAIPMKADTVNGITRQFLVSEALEVDAIERRSGSGNLTIGSLLTGVDELQLGSATTDTRILGDLLVDGSSTISVNETVTGNFTVEGNTDLGTNDGDVINLGGGTSDTVNLLTDLTVGAGLVSIGTGVGNYLDSLWLDAVNANGPAVAAYDLTASGTNAGAYAVGVDPTLLANATATDLMTVLDQLDAAIGASSGAGGTDNLTFTINQDAVAGTDEDPALILAGGDGGTSVINSQFIQDSSADQVHFTITDNGTQIDPVLSIGDSEAAEQPSLVPCLELTATNNVPANVVADMCFTVTGSNTFGSLTFGGTGLAAGSVFGPETDNVVDLGATAANRFQDAFFGGTTTTGASFVVGNTTLDNDSLDNTAGAFTVDVQAAAADGTLTLTNTGAGATGADIDFAVAGSAIQRTGDGLAEILVANLLDSSANETITGTYTFSAGPILDATAALQFTERATDPTNVADNGFVYTKDVGGITELFYQDDGGQVIQLTNNGAINAATSLQAAYDAGPGIAVVAGTGPVAISNDTDAANTLNISRAPAGATAGDALTISMGANTTGVGASIATTVGATGDALFVNNAGSGDALNIQDGGASVLQVTGAGAVNVTPTSGQNFTATVAGAGVIDLDAAGAITLDSTAAGISLNAAGASTFATSAGNLTLDSAAGELQFDDTGNSGLTLSETGDRVLARTGTGELFNGITSIVGALNALVRAIEENGTLSAEFPIENTVTVAVGDVIAASTTSGRVTQANANAETNASVIGIALSGGTGDLGGTVNSRFALPGSVVSVSGATFTAGAPVFSPDGTGIPVTLAPADVGDRVIRLGYAISATQFVFQPVQGFAL